MENLDGIGRKPTNRRLRRPAERPQVSPPVIKVDKEDTELEGTRWLYESEDDYKHAQKKLAAEIAREKFKKDLARKARVAKLRELADKLRGILISRVKSLRSWVIHSDNRKKVMVGSAGVVVLLIAIAVVPGIFGGKKSSTVLTSQSQAPEFSTISPGGDIKSTESGQIAYDPGKKVASFTDKIEGVAVTVSQQALPEKFASDRAGELEKFAHEIYANEKLEIGDTTAYIGVSSKGPQTVVLIKNDLLLFISTESKVQNLALFDYIDSLR